MAIKTVRPNSTTGSTNSEATGAATRHAALNDDSDSSYLVTSGVNSFSQTGLGLPNLELPAGSLIKSVAIRVRTKKLVLSESIAVGLTGSSWTLGNQVVSWSNYTTTTVMYESKARTEAEVNAADLSIELPYANTRMAEAYLDVTYAPKPVVTVGGPSGTISDNTPTIEWTSVLDSDGGKQAYYEVKVFNDATYEGGGFNPSSSGPLMGYKSGEGVASSAAIDYPLPDDTYKAYVRVAQVVHGETLYSDWDAGSAFTVDAPQPNSPIVNVSLDNENGRIYIQIDEDSDGEVDADLYEVQRSLDGGSTWEQLRTPRGDGLVEPEGSGHADAWDYETRNGLGNAQYIVRSINTTENSVSAWAETGGYSWYSSDTWIKNPLEPWLNTKSRNLNYEGEFYSLITVRSFPSQSRETGATVHKVLGRPDPIVTRDAGGPAYESGEIVIATQEREDREALDELLSSGRTLLLQFPESADEPDRYIEITGTVQRGRIVDKSFSTYRDETWQWQEVAPPEGPMESWS